MYNSTEVGLRGVPQYSSLGKGKKGKISHQPGIKPRAAVNVGLRGTPLSPTCIFTAAGESPFTALHNA